MPLLRQNEIELHGQKFLCELYHKSDGIAERRFNRLDIFNALRLEGFAGGERQATDEIVQYLRRLEWIKTFENNDDIKLTDVGLDRAARVCR
jgi:hypothetical protein